MQLKVTFGLFLLFFTGSKLAAQSTYSLSQCIEWAMKNNLSVKQAELNTMMYENNYTQSKASVLPSLNSGANHTYNIGRTIDRYTNTFANSTVLSQNFYLSSQVVLWSGLSQYFNVQQNKFNWLSGQENTEQVKNDLCLNIATLYLQALYNKEMKEVAAHQLEISKEQFDRTQKLVEAGTMAKSAEYDVKAQLAADQLTYVSAQNAHLISLLSLQQVLNLDTVAHFDIAEPQMQQYLAEKKAVNAADLFQDAMKNQHGIKSAEYAVMAAQQGLQLAKGRISPTLSFGASIGTGYSGLAKNYSYFIDGYDTTGITNKGDYVLSPRMGMNATDKAFSDQVKDNVNKSLGFTLTFPVFNGLQNYTAIKNARLQWYNAKLGYDIKKQALFKSVVQAVADASAAKNKLDASLAAEDAAKESFKYTKQKYEVGAVSVFDFNSSKNRWMKAQSDAISARYDYVFKLKVLEYYQGMQLSF